MPNEDPKSLDIKINFIFHPRMPTVAAQHMIMQEDDSDVVLSFFETQLPFLPADAGDRLARVEELKEKGIGAECVARVRIAKHRLPLFVKTLSDASAKIESELEALGG